MTYAAEAAVLGALLKQPDLMDECHLKPEEFVADERHSLIMESLRFSYDQDGTIDIAIMGSRSGKNLMKIGGPTYLLQLRDACYTTAHFGHYQSIIRNAYIKRRAAEELQGIVNSGMSDDDLGAAELVANGMSALEELAEMTKAGDKERGLRHISSHLKGHDDKIIERKKKRGMTGTKTVSPHLDKITGGHQRGDLDIYAARPSMGKTALFVNEMNKAAAEGTTVAFFSLEMTADQVIDRFVCSRANIENSKMRSGDFDDSDWERYSFARDEFDNLPIYIDDESATLQDIRRKVKALIKEHGDNLVIYIDYLQLVDPGRNFKEPHMGTAYVSKGLKAIARSLNVPVVAISAVGRAVEQRQDKRPMMSDLRESGSIESDADIIAFLYRDDYYNHDSEKKGIVEIILAKGRNVGIGTVEMAFLKQYGKFVDLDYSGQAPNGGGNVKNTGQNQQRRGVRGAPWQNRKGSSDD